MKMDEDPAIKLFGNTIIPPPTTTLHSISSSMGVNNININININNNNNNKDACSETTKSEACDSLEEEPCKPDKPSALDNGKEDNEQTHPSQENKEMVDAKSKKDQLKTDCDDQDKVLKKPDKIVPCPRCNSLDTKFCYYNNYNVNQPRHFCKKCQRYWTAGGTMRNVPVGAGRRKNKHIASLYRQVMVSSDGIPHTQVNTSDSARHQVNSCGGLSVPLGICNGNTTVLKCGSDAPLCESMTVVLNLKDQTREVEMGVVVCGENGEEPSSCGSSVSASTCSKIELPDAMAQMVQHGTPGCCEEPAPSLPNSLQCYPGPPWVYPWNSGWNSVASIGSGQCASEMFYRMHSDNLKQVQWGSTPMMVAPTFCSPSMPFPYVPTSYWGGISSSWAAGAWNVPWHGSNGTQSSSSSSSRSGSSSSRSPTLGKHSRAANTQEEGEDKTEKCLWVPKTLRIDDPDEAAKSSIWATLGIKPGQSEPILKGGIFKAFQPKAEVNDHASDATQLLQANPAAFSRSQTFQESA